MLPCDFDTEDEDNNNEKIKKLEEARLKDRA